MMMANRDGTFTPISVDDVLNRSHWTTSFSAPRMYDDATPTRLDKVPEWVQPIEGFRPEVYSTPIHGQKCFIVNWHPVSTLGVGFTTIMVADKNGKPFAQMDALIKAVAAERNKLGAGERQGKYRIDENGRISGMFGIIDACDFSSLMEEIFPYFMDWREFPNATEWELVKRLKNAMQDVRAMKREVRTKRIANEIERNRVDIKQLQDKIAELEKVQNELYEKAADAANLLEENGVKVDFEGDDNKKADMDGYLTIDADVDAGELSSWMNKAYATVGTYAPGAGIACDLDPATNTLVTIPQAHLHQSNASCSSDLSAVDEEELANAIATAWGNAIATKKEDDE